METMHLIGTGGAVAVTIGILQAIKRMEIIPVKFIPLLGLVIGMIVCILGASAKVLPISGLAESMWYGLMTGLTACGLFSGVKNVLK